MFKVGDIVRCKTDRYRTTSYKRPCEVVGINGEYSIDVRCLGSDGSIFEVKSSLFELVPKHEILHKGMYVEDKYGDKYEFIKYGVRGIRVGHLYKSILFYDDIVYSKNFKV